MTYWTRSVARGMRGPKPQHPASSCGEGCGRSLQHVHQAAVRRQACQLSELRTQLGVVYSRVEGRNTAEPRTHQSRSQNPPVTCIRSSGPRRRLVHSVSRISWSE
jgi:hypothetical protein